MYMLAVEGLTVQWKGNGSIHVSRAAIPRRGAAKASTVTL